jgi:hypothetical protein
VLSGGSTPSDISPAKPEATEIPSRCHLEGDCAPDDLEDDLEAEAEPVQEDELPRHVMECVERTPGQRTDAIAKALDTTTAMIAPTQRMLVQGRHCLETKELTSFNREHVIPEYAHFSLDVPASAGYGGTAYAVM